MENLFCSKCGSNNYYTEQKNNNLVARCKDCDAFIKNVPTVEIKFYFGKYSQLEVSKCSDINYLYWFIKNIKSNDRMSKAIARRIHELEKESGL